MNSKQLLALYGLKWNPFSHELPLEALHATKRVDHFSWRVENLVLDGGFALISGESGMGKSVALRQLAGRLGKLRDVTVAEFSRPQSGLSDFYRELGVLFGVELRTSNRYGGFRTLRERWQNHIETTLCRAVLLIDEAQEMQPVVLSELRLLSSICFDSQVILTTVLCGDNRLPEKLKLAELLPLGSRIQVRLNVEAWSRDEIATLIGDSIARAGAPRLMTKELVATVAEHCAGSPRIAMNLANELLLIGAKKELKQLDERLYLETYAPGAVTKPRRRQAA